MQRSRPRRLAAHSARNAARESSEAQLQLAAGRGHADRDRDAGLEALELGGGGEPQALGDRQGGIAVAARQHERELLAAEARREVRGAAIRLQHGGEAAQHLVAGRVAERVVDALEVVEVADQQRHGRAVPSRLRRRAQAGSRDVRVDVGLEVAAVAQARERVVLGQAAHRLELAQRLDGADRLVGERAQGLQPLAAREHVVGGVVDPDQARDRAVAAVERHDQPVAVPGVRAAAVALRRVEALDLLRRDPAGGLLVEQDAALPGERRIGERGHLGDRRLGQLRDLGGRPAGAGARRQAPVALVERQHDLLEAQRLADAGAHGVQRLLGRGAAVELGRDAQEVLDRGVVTRALGLRLGVLDRDGDVRRHRAQDLEVVVGRAPAAERLVHREEAQDLRSGAEERHEERVVGVPGVGVVAGRDLRHVGERAVGLQSKSPARRK